MGDGGEYGIPIKLSQVHKVFEGYLFISEGPIIIPLAFLDIRLLTYALIITYIFVKE